MTRWFHPLAQQAASFRTNISASLSPKFDLNVNASWSKTDNRIEPESDLFISLYYVGMQNYGFKGPGLDKETTDVDGTPLNDYLQYAPGDIMQFLSQQDVPALHGQRQCDVAAAVVAAERRHDRHRPREPQLLLALPRGRMSAAKLGRSSRIRRGRSPQQPQLRDTRLA